MGTRQFTLEAPAPFRLDLTVWALRRRAHNALDLWDDGTWRRSLPAGHGALGLAVTQVQGETGNRLAVTLDRPGTAPGRAALAEARRVVTRALGLEVDLGGFYALAEGDCRLSTLAQRFLGMRPPRFPSVFEALVNAVACQQLSLTVGIHLLNRLATHLDLDRGMDKVRPAFPTPEQLATADPTELRELGFSGAKTKTLVTLGQKVASGEVDLEALGDLDDRTARDLLVGLPGIGRWSAEYTLLRGLGRLDVLPGDDVGAQNNLRRRFGLAADGRYDAVAELSREWWPYGGLVYFHLLLDRLAEEGYVEPSPGRAEKEPGRVSARPGRRGSA